MKCVKFYHFYFRGLKFYNHIIGTSGVVTFLLNILVDMLENEELLRVFVHNKLVRQLNQFKNNINPQ